MTIYQHPTWLNQEANQDFNAYLFPIVLFSDFLRIALHISIPLGLRFIVLSENILILFLL